MIKKYITLFAKLISNSVISLSFLLHPYFLYADESDINPILPREHSFVYIIYDNINQNLPILYTTYTFRSEFDGGGEIPDTQIFMKPGTYVINTVQSYYDTDFELEFTENELKKRFVFRLQKNKLHYVLISMGDNGEPSLEWLNKKQGKEFIKRFVRAETTFFDY